MPFAAAAGVAASVVGSVISSSMQSDAVSGAQDSANAAQAQGRDQARADLQPYRDAGSGALPRINALLGLPGGDMDQQAAYDQFRSTPGYGFALSEGLRAVDTGAAARGLLRSGSTLRAEQTLGQGLADQTFGQHYNRLLGLAQLGGNAAAGSATASTEAGKGIAGTNVSAGTAQANILGNQNTAIQNGIGSIYGAGQQAGWWGKPNALMGGSGGWNQTGVTA